MPSDTYEEAAVGEVYEMVEDVMLKSALILTIMRELANDYERKELRKELAKANGSVPAVDL
jgi:hypothetical protein